MLSISDFKLPDNSLCNKNLSSIVCILSSVFCILSSAHYICRERSTNQLLFMQNKPNVKDAQINVNSYMKSKYEKLDTWLSGKNKPNSNPIRQACVVCEGVAGLNKPNPSGLRCLRRSCRTDQPQFPKG